VATVKKVVLKLWLIGIFKYKSKIKNESEKNSLCCIIKIQNYFVVDIIVN
jgi:hypothetical protein